MKGEKVNQDRDKWLAEKLAAFEKWAEDVKPEDLKPATLESMGAIAVLVNQQEEINKALAQAVADARKRGRTWSEIGAMLGVSKQAAHRKYGAKSPAQSHSLGQG